MGKPRNRIKAQLIIGNDFGSEVIVTLMTDRRYGFVINVQDFLRQTGETIPVKEEDEAWDQFYTLQWDAILESRNNAKEKAR